MKHLLHKLSSLRLLMSLAVLLGMGSSAAWADDYELVTSAPTDWSGDYVIVNEPSTSASTFIADGTVTGNSFSTASAVKTLSAAGISYDATNQKLTGVTDGYVFNITPSATSGKYYITLKGANKTIYLIANSSTSSSSISTAEVTTNANWTISLGNNGNVYLVGNSGRYVGWNSSYFRAYAASNKDTYKAYIFKKVVDASKVATPTISVPTGAFVSTKTITIACETDDATIFYTTDGTEPSSSNGDEYDSENKPVISETTTVKAIAVKDDLTDSEVATETFTKETVLVGMSALAAKTNTLDETVYVSLSNAQVTYVNGSHGYMEDASKGAYIYNMSPTLNKVYDGIFSIKYQFYNQMPEIKTITAVEGTISDGSTWTPTTLTASALDDNFTANLGRRIKIENYTVTNASKLTENISFYTSYFNPSLEVGSRYTLVGYPYNNNGTRQFRLVSAVTPPEAPTFDFAEGDFSEAFTLHLACETDGVAIYYTTDGSTPTTSSNSYDDESGINVSTSTTTIKAIAVKDGMESNVASATYTYTAVAKPAFSPVDGSEVYYGETVTITCATDEATIYYTTNGDIPTKSSNVYSVPVAINDAMTLKAIAVKGEDKSSVSSATYTLKNPDVPTFSISAGAVERGTTVTISSRAGTTIYYTTDGTDPAESGTDAESNSVNVTIDAAKTLRAICLDGAANISEESSNSYTIVKVATPAVSTAAGEVKAGTAITLTCATEGTTIYYTLDGSTPTASSTEYSEPITIDVAKTIKAIAIKTNYDDSDVLTAAYTIRDYEMATFNFTSSAGREAITITNAGQSGGGKGIDLSVDDIQITGTSGYVNTGSNYLQDYASATMTVQMKAQDNVISFYIKSITITTTNASNNNFSTGDNISSSGETWTYTAPNTTTTSVEIGNTAQCRINSIIVNYVIAKKTVATLSYDNSSVKFDDPMIGTISSGLPILTITPIAASSAVTYTSSNTDVAIIASDGTVTGVGEGTTTITASISDNGTYTDASASYTLQMGLADGGLVYDSDAVALTFGDVFSAPTLTKNTSSDVSYTSSNSNVASINASTGEVTINSVGTAVITASASKDEDYKACEATYTITVNAPSGQTSSATTVFYESFDTNKSTGGNDDTWNGSAGGGAWNADNTWTRNSYTYGANECVRISSGNNSGSITTPSITTTPGVVYKLTFKAGSWTGKNSKLSLSATGAGSSLSLNSQTLVNEEFNDYSATFTAAGSSVTITFSSAKDNALFLDEVRVTYQPITSTTVTTTGGYATYCYQYPLNLDGISGAKAYKVSSLDKENEKVMLTEITGTIKGGVPFILKSDADNANIEIPLADESTIVPDDNLLVGTLAPTFVEQTSGDYTNFAYSKSNGCFVKLGDAGNTVPANRAYLPIKLGGSSPVKALTFDFANTTGINTVANSQQPIANSPIFNLAGQRVDGSRFKVNGSGLKTGIYIVNGKKVLVK